MSYREIEIDGFEPQAVADQAAPMLQWVEVDSLVIDTSYQREIGRRNVAAIKAIAADFRWSRFSPVLLAPIPDGRFAIIDGQHRAHAAKICGIERVPAMIVPIDRAEQASAFSHVNAQTVRITAHHIFKAALAAGEPWAVEANAAVAAAACCLMTYTASTSAKKPGQVYCIGLVRDVAQKGWLPVLSAVLRGIVDYDETGRVPLYSDYILRPLVFALAEAPDLAGLDVGAFLRANDPFKVINAVDRLLAEGEIEGTARVQYRRAFQMRMRQFAREAA